MDVATCTEEAAVVKQKIRAFRDNVDSYHKTWYQAAVELANSISVEPSIPRRVQRQKNRNNVPAESPEEYYRRVITVPLLGKRVYYLPLTAHLCL